MNKSINWDTYLRQGLGEDQETVNPEQSFIHQLIT